MSRKQTKCDRATPCSSCIAAGLHCHLTRRSAEKRQRILISARYDEAMDNIDRSLREVSQALQTLASRNDRTHSSPADSPMATATTPMSSISGLSEGYRGDSSFKAHVQRVTDALRDAASSLDLSLANPSLSETIGDAAELENINTPNTGPAVDTGTQGPSSVQYPELERRSLPPVQPVLRLLRLAQTEQQRIFIDVPVIEETEFSELCQNVYFAVNDYSIAVWSIVNTGLFYLFLNLEQSHYAHVGVTSAELEAYTTLLSANIEAAIQSLRLCQEPSLEACQALDLMVSTRLVLAARSRGRRWIMYLIGDRQHSAKSLGGAPSRGLSYPRQPGCVSTWDFTICQAALM
jgi:hypothetical protein